MSVFKKNNFLVVREEESKRQEAHLKSEMEEKEKLHQETVERLQLQVKVQRGFLCCFHIRKWWPLPDVCLISDSPAGEEQAREEEQRGGHSSRRQADLGYAPRLCVF